MDGRVEDTGLIYLDYTAHTAADVSMAKLLTQHTYTLHPS